MDLLRNSLGLRVQRPYQQREPREWGDISPMLEMGRWSLDGEVNHGMEKGYSLFLDRKRSDQNMYIDIFK